MSNQNGDGEGLEEMKLAKFSQSSTPVVVHAHMISELMLAEVINVNPK